MSSPSPSALPRGRNGVIVAIDVAAGIVFIVIGITLALGVFISALAYQGLHAGCGAGPFEGITCNGTVLAIVVYGLMAVAVFALFLGFGFFLVNLIRKRLAFYWPLGAIVVTVVAFYLGTWVAGLTVP